MARPTRSRIPSRATSSGCAPLPPPLVVCSSVAIRYAISSRYRPGNVCTDERQQGVIAGVLVVLGTSLNGRPVTDAEKEAITALCAAGALFGAIVAGITSNKYGRKLAFYKVTHGWRYMIALGAIPSILLGVFLFFCKPGMHSPCLLDRADFEARPGVSAITSVPQPP